ncbi:MAG: hypothetical protein PHR30_04595 [Gallionellaceae bacterium]|nr:hypothetical protein [Gallionellaceae bacterium]
MSDNIQFTWDVSANSKQHMLVVSVESDFFMDTLTAHLDGKPLFKTKVGGSSYKGEYKFNVDSSPYTIEWQWSQTTGKPELIDLKNGKNEVVHRYGEGTTANYDGSGLAGWLFMLFFIAIIFFTNPSHEKHKEAIRNYIAQQAPIASVLGIGRVAAWATEYKSYGIVSITEDGGRTISIGALGMVFVVGIK